jgi:hypothetical protein
MKLSDLIVLRIFAYQDECAFLPIKMSEWVLGAFSVIVMEPAERRKN